MTPKQEQEMKAREALLDKYYPSFRYVLQGTASYSVPQESALRDDARKMLAEYAQMQWQESHKACAETQEALTLEVEELMDVLMSICREVLKLKASPSPTPSPRPKCPSDKEVLSACFGNEHIEGTGKKAIALRVIGVMRKLWEGA